MVYSSAHDSYIAFSCILLKFVKLEDIHIWRKKFDKLGLCAKSRRLKFCATTATSTQKAGANPKTKSIAERVQ